MKEVWKDITGFKGLYQVSNFGRVKRVAQMRPVKNQVARFYPEKILSTHINMHGYEIVQIKEDGRHFSKQVHRIMAEVFIPNPRGLEQVNHRNGVKHDNRLENLEWISRRGNSLHAVYELKVETGKIPCRRIRCVETGRIYPSVHSAARDMGIAAICISRAANGCTKTSCGLHWRFV